MVITLNLIKDVLTRTSQIILCAPVSPDTYLTRCLQVIGLQEGSHHGDDVQRKLYPEQHGFGLCCAAGQQRRGTPVTRLDAMTGATVEYEYMLDILIHAQ